MSTVEVQCTRVEKNGVLTYVGFEQSTKAPAEKGAPALSRNGLTLAYDGGTVPFVPGRRYDLVIKEVE